MTNLGFKKITVDNWLEPDGVSASFVSVSSVDGTSHPMTGDDWVKEILIYNLNEAVPSEVQDLYEVARGALAYAYFFYPLWALAGEQLFRVAESALTYKCRAMEAPKSVYKFHQKVEYLASKSILSEQDKIAWDAIRNLRNAASHPVRQSIFSPFMVLQLLENISDSINSIFNGT